MNTIYSVVMKCQEKGKMPIISPYIISKNQFDRIQEIVHENTAKNNGKYPFMNKKEMPDSNIRSGKRGGKNDS